MALKVEHALVETKAVLQNLNDLHALVLGETTMTEAQRAVSRPLITSEHMYVDAGEGLEHKECFTATI